jgi:hypothetical protein
MSDNEHDDLVALYRQAAGERPSPSTDARILAAAERAHKRRYGFTWSAGLAAAAILILIASAHFSTPNPPAPTAHGSHKATYTDSTSLYLMQMDVDHLSSPVAQYLTSGTAPMH